MNATMDRTTRRTRREPTAEQRAKAEARRAKFRELCKGIAAMSEDERAALAARMPGMVTCQGHALSVKNCCLIALQCPTATIVGGFRQWLKEGRAVRKGERGLMIWVFCGGGTSEGAAPSDGSAEPDGQSTHDRRFIVGTVFDVSQTDAKPMDETNADEVLSAEASQVATIAA